MACHRFMAAGRMTWDSWVRDKGLLQHRGCLSFLSSLVLLNPQPHPNPIGAMWNSSGLLHSWKPSNLGTLQSFVCLHVFVCLFSFQYFKDGVRKPAQSFPWGRCYLHCPGEETNLFPPSKDETTSVFQGCCYTVAKIVWKFQGELSPHKEMECKKQI